MAATEEISQPITWEQLVPDEVRQALASHEMVVWCWACNQVLYEAEAKNVVTNRVAISSATDHENAFSTVDHEVDIFFKGDELAS